MGAKLLIFIVNLLKFLIYFANIVYLRTQILYFTTL